MKKIPLILAILIWLYLCFIPYFPEPSALHIWTLNVGQGESIFIQTSDKTQILFDGGPDSSVLNEMGQIMPPWDQEIDLIIVSHNHSDHIRGLIQVMRRYKVKEIWQSGSIINTADYDALEKEIGAHQIKVRLFNANSPPIQISNLQFECLYPVKDMLGENPKNPHLSDLVFRVKYNNQHILLTGDLNLEHINEMTTRCQKQDGCSFSAELFQVPHHGSATGLTTNFINLVNPKIAVIPVGLDNKLGHPNPKTLKILDDKKIKTLRTDIDKRIHVMLRDDQIILLDSS